MHERLKLGSKGEKVLEKAFLVITLEECTLRYNTHPHGYAKGVLLVSLSLLHGQLARNKIYDCQGLSSQPQEVPKILFCVYFSLDGCSGIMYCL